MGVEKDEGYDVEGDGGGCEGVGSCVCGIGGYGGDEIWIRWFGEGFWRRVVGVF